MAVEDKKTEVAEQQPEKEVINSLNCFCSLSYDLAPKLSVIELNFKIFVLFLG